MNLGVNIDHIATLRNARGGFEPDIVEAAKIILKEDVFALTMHLREDRRHIKDEDLYNIKKLGAKINLEMAATKEILNIALDVEPYSVCIVPERRQEITTEGGLDAYSQKEYLKEFIKPLKDKGIIVSFFTDAQNKALEASKYAGADYVELHTGCFSNAFLKNDYQNELEQLKKASLYAQDIGLKVNAGHGLTYDNVYLMKEVANLSELNIGHSIISKAVFIGLDNAVKEMLKLIK